MPETIQPDRQSRRWWAESLIAAIVFVCAYTQSPFFYSNQNQYLLHGMADAGVGMLSEDWLAQTRDPTPLFSLIVECAFRVWPPILFGIYALILSAYIVWLRQFLEACWSEQFSRRVWLTLLAGVVLSHSALGRWLCVQAFGVDYAWYFQCGVAGQYLSGAGIQPSVFGVFLLGAIAAFARGKDFRAICFVLLACLFHTTYLLASGLLVAGWLLALLVEKRNRRAACVASVAMLGVMPIVGFVYLRFAPTNLESFRESQRLLAEVRIPHHSLVYRWFDLVAAVQVVWVVLGLSLIPLWRVRIAMLTTLILAWIGTILTALTNHATLELMFPWRVSALLVPVATAVIATRFSQHFSALRIIGLGSVVVLLACALGGIWITLTGIGYAANHAEDRLLQFVKDHQQPGQVYLIPSRIPSLASGKRGSISTTFTPPPRPKLGTNLIPVDFQRFRLMTGVPIYVDFKAVPYADREVLEWYRRLRTCERWYDERTATQTLDEIRAAGVTHVVSDANRVWPGLAIVYSDEQYTIYTVSK